jgi:hypothetical protein
MKPRNSKFSIPVLCALVGGFSALSATEAQARKGFRMGTPAVVPLVRPRTGTPEAQPTAATQSAPDAARQQATMDAATQRAQQTLAAEKAIVPQTVSGQKAIPAPGVLICIAGCYTR